MSLSSLAGSARMISFFMVTQCDTHWYQNKNRESVRCRTRNTLISKKLIVRAAETVAENDVALARHLLEPCWIENCNFAARRPDQTGTLKQTRGNGDTGSTRAKKPRDDVVGHWNCVA